MVFNDNQTNHSVRIGTSVLIFSWLN